MPCRSMSEVLKNVSEVLSTYAGEAGNRNGSNAYGSLLILPLCLNSRQPVTSLGCNRGWSLRDAASRWHQLYVPSASHLSDPGQSSRGHH